MEKSLFSRVKDNPFKITFYFLEILEKQKELLRFKTRDEKGISALVPTLVSQSLSEAGLKEKPTSFDVSYVLQRLKEFQEKKPSEKINNPNKVKRSFGQFFVDWFSSLSAESICIFLANHDFDIAFDLYTKEDIEIVRRLASDKFMLEFERGRMGFEAALFGFGGGYGGSADENVMDIDDPDFFDSLDAALGGRIH
jgi:hypothetical protein